MWTSAKSYDLTGFDCASANADRSSSHEYSARDIVARLESPNCDGLTRRGGGGGGRNCGEEEEEAKDDCILGDAPVAGDSVRDAVVAVLDDLDEEDWKTTGEEAVMLGRLRPRCVDASEIGTGMSSSLGTRFLEDPSEPLPTIVPRLCGVFAASAA